MGTIQIAVNDRTMALSTLWEEFQANFPPREFRKADELVWNTEENRRHYWAVHFANYILDNQDELKVRTEWFERSRKEPTTWQWFHENNGICPNCHEDLHGKTDVNAHKKGTCKG